MGTKGGLIHYNKVPSRHAVFPILPPAIPPKWWQHRYGFWFGFSGDAPRFAHRSFLYRDWRRTRIACSVPASHAVLSTKRISNNQPRTNLTYWRSTA